MTVDFRDERCVLKLVTLSQRARLLSYRTKANDLNPSPTLANAAHAVSAARTGLSCTSPCSLKVKRRGDFVVTIKMDGHDTVTTNITSSIDGDGGAAMVGNVFVGGIIGAGVYAGTGAGTGAMSSHKPNPLVVELVPSVKTE